MTNGVFLLYLTFCLKFLDYPERSKQQYLNLMYASLSDFRIEDPNRIKRSLDSSIKYYLIILQHYI